MGNRPLASILVAMAVGHAATASAAEYRLQAGGGYSVSVVDQDISEPIEGTPLTATLESVDTGSGPIAGAAFWADDLVGENLSLGVEYVYSGFQPDVTVGLGAGNLSRSIELDSDAQLHTAFVNLAWRQNQGQWHPYAGAGLGLGYVRLDIIGDRLDGYVDSATGGIQGFVGIDYDISEDIYVGATARLFYIDARLIGIDLRFLELQGGVHLGVRF